MSKNTHTLIEYPKCVQHTLAWLKQHPRFAGWVLMGLGFIPVLLFAQMIWEWLNGNSAAFRNYGLIFAALLAGIIAVWRGLIADQQTKTNRERLDAEQRGQITDRIDKAIRNMHACNTDDATKPNLIMRIESLYALHAISQDSPRDHTRMMDYLTDYIREHAPAGDAIDIPPKENNESASRYREQLGFLLPLPRKDIQIAIDFVVHKAHIEQEQGYKRDLSNTNLQGIVIEPKDNLDNTRFDGAQLQGINLSNAQLQGATLRKAQVQGGILRNAQLSGATFRKAQLQGADFYKAQGQAANFSYAQLQTAEFWGAQLPMANFGGADLQRVDFYGAQLHKADFKDADLQGADLRKAQLHKANLRQAQLSRANFGGANLQGASFVGAQVRAANFGGAQLQDAVFKHAQLQGAWFRETDLSATFLLEQDQLQQSFGDGSVTLPDGFDWPNHWPQETLDDNECEKQYKAWLKASYPDLYKERFGG